jgi:hypothetical protein
MKAKTPRQAADDYERKQNKKTREAKRVAKGLEPIPARSGAEERAYQKKLEAQGQERIKGI